VSVTGIDVMLAGVASPVMVIVPIVAPFEPGEMVVDGEDETFTPESAVTTCAEANPAETKNATATAGPTIVFIFI